MQTSRDLDQNVVTAAGTVHIARWQWVALFALAYRKLRPEIGQLYAELHGRLAYRTLSHMDPDLAAQKWYVTFEPD